MPQEELEALLIRSAKSLGFVFESEHRPAMFHEKFQLGAYLPVLSMQVSLPEEFTIRIVSASADPFVRFMLGMSTSSQAQQGLKSVSAIIVSPLNGRTRPAIRAFMRNLMGELPGVPWSFPNHPRFRASPLLRLRVEKRWRCWLD